MKAYKIEILVIDHDEVGEEDIKHILENTHYPNYCIAPEVKDMVGVDIGEWDDSHPLNKHSTAEAEYRRLFGLEGRTQ